MFAGHVSIEGDTDLAQEFSDILANLDIDWEELLSAKIGDVVAHQTMQQVRQAQDYVAQMADTLQQNLSEYLTEEARLLPYHYEVEDWLVEVERIRDDVERLSVRVDLLTQDFESK